MKLYVCFLWHMHQPYYRDPETGNFILPWVRLHAVKDYVALPRIFRGIPAVRHTFNLVPSLLIQLREYVEKGAGDAFLDLSRKNALDLSSVEEEFILRHFFSAFAPTMILPQPRYAELYRRRDKALHAIGRPGVAGGFGASEFTDLVTLFNLTWFHPLHREEDPELDRLWRKGRGYTEREKHYVLDRQIDLMAAVIPEYRTLVSRDGGELTTTPMYHPILPLLIDTRTAQDAAPGVPLPNLPFAWPEDAEEQIRRGRDAFRNLFGNAPAGLWPSEGSISPKTLEMAARAGFAWTATDEILLAKALGKAVRRDGEGIPVEPGWLYHPYVASTPGGAIRIFFRDHHLSDLIGFEYARWDAIDAANNFVAKIRRIYESLASLPRRSRQEAYVVPVILDGENAWEYYYDSGRLFLTTLLTKLAGLAPRVSCVTFTEALESLNYHVPLPKIPTGSWIDGTFHIWIGHPEDHAAWEMLSRARTLWQSKAKELGKSGARTSAALASALEHLHIAEGSDWCWWYGDDHFTPDGPEFDRLFRHQLKAAYHDLGETPPDSLDIPIITADRMPRARNVLPCPIDYIAPRIDGKVTSYFEWSQATAYHPSPEYGAMHRAGFGLMAHLHYGFGRKELYFRVDFHEPLLGSDGPVDVEFLFPKKDLKLGFRFSADGAPVAVSASEIVAKGPEAAGTGPPPAAPSLEAIGIKAAFIKVLEVAIPFEALHCVGEDRIEFFLTIRPQGSVGERWPMYGQFTAELPGQDFEKRMWEV